MMDAAAVAGQGGMSPSRWRFRASIAMGSTFIFWHTDVSARPVVKTAVHSSSSNSTGSRLNCVDFDGFHFLILANFNAVSVSFVDGKGSHT